MRPHTIQVADDFLNVRGSFKIVGAVDIGTQASLVRRRNGRFVFLDSYALSGAVEREVLELTHGGKDIEAVLNVHPFHTVFARKMHERFPHAKLYGTARHVSRFPELPWEALRTEDPELHTLFAEDFEFSVPRGVDFISANENVHFSSVLVLHRAYSMSFHPTLAKALEKRPGAARDFRDWAGALIERWRDAETLCAAHTATLTAGKNQGAPIHARLLKALGNVDGKLTAHERKYG
jgi:hypothetical protein